MMRKLSILLAHAALLLEAQAPGEAAIATAQVAKENHWQNWTFLGSAIATATAAIWVIAINNGNDVQTTSH